MEIAVIGVNHLTAPIQIGEKMSFTDSQKIEFLNQVLDHHIREALILATCNRSELYLCHDNIESKLDCIISIYHDFCHIAGIEDYLFIKVGEEAMRHMYRVTAGLESIVLGEDQILGQVKDAHEFAMEIGSSGKVLNKCFREAITVAKKMKEETKISHYPVSISSIGVKHLKEEMGGLKGKKGLLIGMGTMGKLALEYLLEEEVESIYIANRTLCKINDLKETCPIIIPIDYEERYEMLNKVDFVISSTTSPHLVLQEKYIPSIEHKLYLLDIAMPRDIEASIGNKENIYLYDIDDLHSIVDKNTEKRKKLAQQVEVVIEESLEELIGWLQTIKIDPTIESLYERCEEIQKDTMNYIRRKIDLNGREDKIIEKMIMSSLKRLIREPVHRLKEIQDTRKQEEYMKIIKDLFDL